MPDKFESQRGKECDDDAMADCSDWRATMSLKGTSSSKQPPCLTLETCGMAIRRERRVRLEARNTKLDMMYVGFVTLFSDRQELKRRIVAAMMDHRQCVL